MSITVHHLDRSRSTKVVWLLEELGVDYDIVSYLRDPKTMRAPPELRDKHPLGKSPVVEIDGVVYAESGAIVEELIDRFDSAGTMRPEPGTDAARLYRYFLHFAEGSGMPPLLVQLLTHRIRHARVPFFVKPVVRGIADKVDANYTTPEVERTFRFLEAHLDDRPWFAGEAFSGADIQMSYLVAAGVKRARLGFETPNLQGWMERATARPAYVRAAEKGGGLDAPG